MLESLVRVAEECARAAGDRLRETFRSGRLEIEMKEKNDFVTSADRAAEEAILEILDREYPDHAILAEESGRRSAGGEYEWIIDPLDGTTNFLEGMPMYGVSIACQRDGETVAAVIYDPERDEMFSAVRGGGARRNGHELQVSGLENLDGAFLATGFPFKARGALDAYLNVFREVFLQARAIRRCGSAALDLASTAAGVFDGFFEFRLAPWDIAAGALLIEEAGGRVCDLDGGRRYLETGNIIAGPALLVDALLAASRLHASEALLDELVPPSTAGSGHSC